MLSILSFLLAISCCFLRNCNTKKSMFVFAPFLFQLDSLDGDWWAEVVDMATQRSIDPDLVFKVKDDLVRTSTTEGTIADM